MLGSKRYDYRYRGWTFPAPRFVFEAHEEILLRFGGRPGFKDQGSVLSAIDAPRRTINGVDAYPGFLDKVAALGYLIARNHGFTDGKSEPPCLS